MKVIKKDLRNNFVKLQVENLDDLWYLSHIIDIGDTVEGITYRKIKLGDGGSDRNVKVVKKKIFLKIRVEKIEFHRYADILRVSGKITAGPEDVAIGTYHTFNVEDKTIFSLEKKEFLDYQIEKLNEAAKPKKLGILLCVFDRENATFAIMKNYGYEVLSELAGNVQKKDSPEQIKNNTFYTEITKLLVEYTEKFNVNKIIIGSPAFWKEYLLKELEQTPLKSKVISASCNSIGKNGITELLSRPEVMSALTSDRIVAETKFIEKLLYEIKVDGKASYGLKDTKHSIEIGAVKELLVSDKLIQDKRQNDSYEELDEVMKLANSMKAEIHIISSEHDGGAKLDGLGGIGAILRYKL